MDCQACREREASATLKVDTTYELCMNCLLDLVLLNLNQRQYKNLVSVHGPRVFFLHSDFYTKEGIALQPYEGERAVNFQQQ